MSKDPQQPTIDGSVTDFKNLQCYSSESDAGLKIRNNLLLHDAEEFIKEEIKKSFEYQNKANKLFKKSNYEFALEEYKRVN